MFTGLARFPRSRHSFLRKSLYVFKREAGLAWLSKLLRRKMWRGKISETELWRFHPALVKRSRNNRGKKLTSPTSCTVHGEGRTNYLIVTYALHPPPPPLSLSLSSLWYQYLAHSLFPRNTRRTTQGKKLM